MLSPHLIQANIVQSDLFYPTYVFLPAAKPTGLVGVSWFFLSFLIKVQKKVKTVKINMVAYVVWVINFESDFRFDLSRGAPLGTKTVSHIEKILLPQNAGNYYFPAELRKVYGCLLVPSVRPCQSYSKGCQFWLNDHIRAGVYER